MNIEISPDSGVGVAASPFSSVQEAADWATTAEEGAKALVNLWIEQGVAFTSGHVVNALREGRGPSLVVNQRQVGQAIQAYFSTGEMPSYDDDQGGEIRPLRKIRQTTRSDTRTPVGTEVYVYGPTEDEIDYFEFELDIATAPAVADGMGGTTSAATALLNATPMLPVGHPGGSMIPPVQPTGTVAVAHGKMLPGVIPLAVVHARGGDGTRLCIPRLAFEALAFESGTPIRGGDNLYVAQIGTRVTVSLQSGGPEYIPMAPTTDRLRMHLTATGLGPIGTEYSIQVSATGLTIDL